VSTTLPEEPDDGLTPGRALLGWALAGAIVLISVAGSITAGILLVFFR